MNIKLKELLIDLDIQEKRLAEITDPEFIKNDHYFRFKKLDANLLIPTYVKNIESLKKEILKYNKQKKKSI